MSIPTVHVIHRWKEEIKSYSVQLKWLIRNQIYEFYRSLKIDKIVRNSTLT